MIGYISARVVAVRMADETSATASSSPARRRVSAKRRAVSIAWAAVEATTAANFISSVEKEHALDRVQTNCPDHLLTNDQRQDQEGYCPSILHQAMDWGHPRISLCLLHSEGLFRVQDMLGCRIPFQGDNRPQSARPALCQIFSHYLKGIAGTRESASPQPAVRRNAL